MNTRHIRNVARAMVFALIASVALLAVNSASASTLAAAKDTMSRLKISTAANHAVVFTLPTGVDFDSTTQTDFLNVDFPASFSESGTWVTGDFTFNDGTARTINAVAQGAGIVDCTVAAGVNNVCIAIDTTAHIFSIKPSATYTASATAATITFVISGTSPDGVLTNPSSAGSATVAYAECDEVAACSSAFTSTHTTSVAVAIADDDQVGVTASVDPSITFDLDTANTDTTSVAPYTVALGTLTTGAVATSSTSGSGIFSVWVRLSTNAASGAAVTVLSANGTNGLVSTSTPADKIASSTATLAAGTAGYGVCVTSTGTGSPTQTSGATFTAVSPFASTCDATTHQVGGLTTSAQNILTASSAINVAKAAVRVKAAISALTPAHNDYTDTLTFIATGTF